MPREQTPDQQQYQKGLNPDNLVTDADLEDDEEAESGSTNVAPVEGEDQPPAGDNIDDDEADVPADDDADESDHISQRP